MWLQNRLHSTPSLRNFLIGKFFNWIWYYSSKASLFYGLYSKDKQCDYYQEFHKEGELLVSFTNVLLRMLINYVLNCLLELDLTLRDERILVEEVYTFGSLIQIIFSFMNFFICAVQRIWRLLLWFFKAKALWVLILE